MKFNHLAKKKELLSHVVGMAKKHRVSKMAASAKAALASKEPEAGAGDETQGLAVPHAPTEPAGFEGMDPETLRMLLDTMKAG